MMQGRTFRGQSPDGTSHEGFLIRSPGVKNSRPGEGWYINSEQEPAYQTEFQRFFQRCEHPLWRPYQSAPGGSLEEYGEFDNERVTDLEWVMYTLIRERVASMYELTYVYNLDEMLKLYDLIMMQRDIEYSRSQKERGGE